jgi:HEPN domain-containing protein
MNGTSPSAAFLALRSFCEEHSSATRLLLVAAQDYAAARCLLQNGLLTGLVLGAQAIEKFLKAYLLFKNPDCAVRRLSHSLPRLLREASALFPELPLAEFAPLADKFGRHYATRYPDNPDASTSMTSADLIELDTFVVFLNENMPCPRHVKFRSGLYALITFSLGYQAAVPPTERWIKINNKALAPLWPRIASDYAAVLRELYP